MGAGLGDAGLGLAADLIDPIALFQAIHDLLDMFAVLDIMILLQGRGPTKVKDNPCTTERISEIP